MNAQNIILFIIIITIKCEEDLQIRIGVPEYICDKDGGVRDVSNDLTKIRLLGKDAQNVNYKFDVNFRTIGKKCYNNRRCTLLKWRAVRDLDHYLKTYSRDKLQAGLIEINNTMFNPGIKYIINVTITVRGKVMEEKQLTVDYVDDVVRKQTKKPMASLMLLAADTSYAYAPYVINAEVNICSNVTSYYFDWELTDDAENSTSFPSRGSELTIPPDTFQGSQSYKIKCTLVNNEDGLEIAKSEQNVDVLKKGLLLRLPVKKIATKVNQDVRIRAYLKDLDNESGDIKVTWSCVDTTRNQQCEYNSDTNELDIYSGFSQPGIYQISLEVSKNEFSESASCTVEVTTTGPVVEIEDVEYPTNPNKGVDIQVTIYELKSSCTLQWTSPKEDGYETVDLTTVPGDVGNTANVTMKEDLFLNELEEFTNGTTDRRHDLVIPPSTDWDGLKGDSKYLFRLIITCPLVVENFDELNETETEMVVTTSDVIIETNAAPVTQPLDVTPPEGDAFVTTFNFKTQKAKDSSEGPIFYKFGYILGERNVILWTLGDVTNCEGTLPFSDDGVQTFVESCDSFGACYKVLGPLIKTKMPEKIHQETILQIFINKMKSGDYAKAFIEAFTILWSYKTDENKTKEFIVDMITQEIEKYLKMEESNFWKTNANELLRNINEFNSNLQLPETTINKVLELRNKLSEGPERYSQRKLLSLRSKRASSLTLHEVRNYLEISELIITTSNDANKVSSERENLRKQLRTYMEKLCTNLKKTQLSLELKTVIFSVEKLKKNSLNTFISVPFEGNSWQISGRIKLGNAIKDTKDKCVGKAIFRDYFDRTGITFFADLLNGSDINESAEIVIFLPKNKSMDTNPKCYVYYNEGWHSECKITQNIANYVKCTCKHLGYYYLDYVQITTTPKIGETTTFPTTTETFISTHNETSEQLKQDNAGTYDTVSYIVIAVSVIGIIILAVTVRKIFQDDDENEDSETFEFPKYAQLHNEEFLNDAHM